MAATRPFLLRVVEQSKRFADLPEVTKGITADESIEDVRTAHAQVFEDFSKAISPDARYWRSYWNTPDLVEDQRFLRLPPAFRKFWKFTRWDDSRKSVLNQRVQVPGTDGKRGIILSPHANRLEFSPLVSPNEVASWELAFESGPIELHYGTPVNETSQSSVTYTQSTETITKS